MTYYRIKQYLVQNGFKRGKAEYVRKMIRELCQDTVDAMKLYYDGVYEQGRTAGHAEVNVSLFEAYKAYEYMQAADELYRLGVLTEAERNAAINMVREKAGLPSLSKPFENVVNFNGHTEPR